MIAQAAAVCGILLAAYAGIATAQPLPNPHQESPPLEPLDPVATALIERAEQLVVQGQFADAKQLAVESLQLLPSAGLTERASRVLVTADAALGITLAPAPVDFVNRPGPAELATVAAARNSTSGDANAEVRSNHQTDNG